MECDIRVVVSHCVINDLMAIWCRKNHLPDHGHVLSLSKPCCIGLELHPAG